MNEGLLTHILNTFVHAIGGGFGRLGPSANHLLYTIMGIDLVFFGLFAIAAEGGQIVVKSMRKLLGYGLFVLLVTQWPKLVAVIVQGFVWAGQTAGGNAPGPSVQDPSAIVDFGFNVAQPMLDKVSTLAHGFTGTMENLPTIGLYELCIVGTIAAFLMIAIQCFIAYLEFMIVAVLSMVLLPFGPWKHTKFLSEKSLGAVISHGIKLMTLTFIVAIAGTVLPSVVPATGVSVHDAIVAMGATLAIALLCMQAPNLAAGLMSGSPSLGAGAMLGTATGAAMGGAAAMGAGRMLATAGGGLGKSGASVVAQAAGAVAQGGIGGIATKAAGAGLIFKAATGAAGAGQAALSGLARKATAPAQNLGEFLKSNFQQGQLREHARQSTKGSSKGASATATGGATHAPPLTAADSTQGALAGGAAGTPPAPAAAAFPSVGGGLSRQPSPTSRDRPSMGATSRAIPSSATGSPAANQARPAAEASSSKGPASAAHPPASSAGQSQKAAPNAKGGQKIGRPADLIKKPAESFGSAGIAAGQQGRQTASQLAQRALDQVRPGDGGGGSVQVNLPSPDE
ncbi:P-type conjugative transfer protein TrbL [Frateuria sp. GZRR35]|uniref:P-type conjugative transfer protein TrbL n=1 Tax=Frateuria sp. GZRR35 TaxID=3351536 RepID=UPI003EDC58B5